VISLQPITEETVAGGARRVLLQARVESGRKPFSGEPMTLTTTSPAEANIQLGGFMDAANQLAHWTVEIPAGQERSYQVTDRDGNISLPVTVKAMSIALTATASPRSDGTFELVISVKTEDGFSVPHVPVSIRYEGVANGDLPTDEKGHCTHIVAFSGRAIEVVVESPGLKSWSTRLISQVVNQAP